MQKTIEEIRADLTQAVREARDAALEELAEFGIVVGALVEEIDYRQKPTGKFYRITEIGSRRLDDSLYLSGQKLRRNGSFGDYHHSIASPDRVRVVTDPAQ